MVYHRDYEGKGASARMLEEYAAFPLFRTVGIDSSFYAPPTPEVLRACAERLPPGFPCREQGLEPAHGAYLRQGAGPGQSGTGQPGLPQPRGVPGGDLRAVPGATSPDHTGPFVFEFQAIGRRSGIGPPEFADRLDRFFSALPREGQYAVEVRNEEFLTPMYFAVLREHGVAHVFNSWTRMPPIGDQLDLPGSVSGPFLVARALLRPGRTYDEAVDAFAPYDRIQEPNPKLRQDLVRLIEHAVQTRIPAYLLVNNRAEGSAPLTIAEVARLLPERSPSDRATRA